MLHRKIERELSHFKDSKHALLITGARQVGKTYIIRKYGEKNFRTFVEINFKENRMALEAFQAATDSDDFMVRLSFLIPDDAEPGETLIFFDEVQACPEIVTMMKFLVEKGKYRYMLSGSLLGIELKNIRSVPVGYMDVIEMYPLDFEEFASASGVNRNVFVHLADCWEKGIPVDGFIHESLLRLFSRYLVIGGMPECVSDFLAHGDLKSVLRKQKSIMERYREDISQYDEDNRFGIEDVFDLIPSEINSKNKRFILKDLNRNKVLERFYDGYLWLKNAGVALPVYNIEEPKAPLLLSRSRNLMKLFMSDTGLLCAAFDDVDLIFDTLKGNSTANFGAIYENAAAMELKAHGHELYYYNSKKHGELDFVIEDKGKVIPIEIKSGKDYSRHRALSNIMESEEYDIEKAYVFSNANVERKGKIFYMPIYMLGMLDRTEDEGEYRVDLDIGVLGDPGYIASVMK